MFLILFFHFFSILNAFDILSRDVSNKCSMTFMYSPPVFRALPLKVKNSDSNYKLYLYREMFNKQQERDKNNIPILFIPGNSGSHKQSRSLASVLLIKGLENLLHFNYDVYACDFNEEMSALNANLLKRQLNFTVKAIETLLSSHSNAPAIVLIGHSLGGVILDHILSHNMLDGINLKLNKMSHIVFISLATPFNKPVLWWHPNFYAFYKASSTLDKSIHMNHQTPYTLTELHITGGPGDFQVPLEYSSKNSVLKGIVVSRSALTVSTNIIPEVWAPNDHLSIVWCNELVRLLTRYIDVKMRLYHKNGQNLAIHSQMLKLENAYFRNFWICVNPIYFEKQVPIKTINSTKNIFYSISPNQFLIKTFKSCVDDGIAKNEYNIYFTVLVNQQYSVNYERFINFEPFLGNLHQEIVKIYFFKNNNSQYHNNNTDLSGILITSLRRLPFNLRHKFDTKDPKEKLLRDVDDISKKPYKLRYLLRVIIDSKDFKHHVFTSECNGLIQNPNQTTHLQINNRALADIIMINLSSIFNPKYFTIPQILLMNSTENIYNHSNGNNKFDFSSLSEPMTRIKLTSIMQHIWQAYDFDLQISVPNTSANLKTLNEIFQQTQIMFTIEPKIAFYSKETNKNLETFTEYLEMETRFFQPFHFCQEELESKTMPNPMFNCKFTLFLQRNLAHYNTYALNFINDSMDNMPKNQNKITNDNFIVNPYLTIISNPELNDNFVVKQLISVKFNYIVALRQIVLLHKYLIYLMAVRFIFLFIFLFLWTNFNFGIPKFRNYLLNLFVSPATIIPIYISHQLFVSNYEDGMINILCLCIASSFIIFITAVSYTIVVGFNYFASYLNFTLILLKKFSKYINGTKARYLLKFVQYFTIFILLNTYPSLAWIFIILISHKFKFKQNNAEIKLFIFQFILLTLMLYDIPVMYETYITFFPMNLKLGRYQDIIKNTHFRPQNFSYYYYYTKFVKLPVSPIILPIIIILSLQNYLNKPVHNLMQKHRILISISLNIVMIFLGFWFEYHIIRVSNLDENYAPISIPNASQYILLFIFISTNLINYV